MRSDLDRLEDMLRVIDNAEKYKDGGEERFMRDELIQVWVLHHLLIIGEAARGLSESLRKEHAGMPGRRSLRSGMWWCTSILV